MNLFAYNFAYIIFCRKDKIIFPKINPIKLAIDSFKLYSVVK